MVSLHDSAYSMAPRTSPESLRVLLSLSILRFGAVSPVGLHCEIALAYSSEVSMRVPPSRLGSRGYQCFGKATLTGSMYTSVVDL